MSGLSRRYSLDRRDAKIAGVCAALGKILGIDPTVLRIGFVAAFFLVEWEPAVIAYALTGLALAFHRSRTRRAPQPEREYDRMARSGQRRSSVKALREDLEPIDRQMMAVDHHLHSPNAELAREIDALREER